MLSTEEQQKLRAAGYNPSFTNEYFFKVKHNSTPPTSRNYTAVFIDCKTKKVYFEGTHGSRKEMLEELKTIVGGIIYNDSLH